MPLDAMCQKMRRMGYNKNTGILCSSDCRQKAILPPKEGKKIALSANERIAEFLDFAIHAKFAYVNKLTGILRPSYQSKARHG